MEDSEVEISSQKRYFLPPYDLLDQEEFLRKEGKIPDYFHLPSRVADLFDKARTLLYRIAGEGRKFYFFIPYLDQLSSYWGRVFIFLHDQRKVQKFTINPVYNDIPKVCTVSLDTEGALSTQDTDGYVVTNSVAASATAEDLETALSKSLGEFLERYSLLLYKEQALLRASLKTLKKKKIKHLDPRSFDLFSQKQKLKYPHLHVYDTDEFLWETATCLHTNEKTLLPAQAIYWNYNRHHSGWTEKFLREGNTNGCAGGKSLEEALVNAIYEYIERDGFLFYWLSGRSPRTLALDSVPEGRLKALIQSFKRYHLEIHFLDTTTDLGVPSCIAAIVDRSGVGPAVSLGGKSGRDWSEILHGAALEALAVYSWSRRHLDAGTKHLSITSPDDPAVYSLALRDRLLLWASERMLGHFEFFTKGESILFSELDVNSRSITSCRDELAFLSQKLSAKGEGYEVYYYEVKSDMLNALSYKVVKVFVPQLLPMYFQEATAPVGAVRLKNSSTVGDMKTNSTIWPHPFP